MLKVNSSGKLILADSGKLACECCPPPGTPTCGFQFPIAFCGEVTLCGWSGYSASSAPYDPLNPGDWNGQGKKWNSRDLSGDSFICEYEGYPGPCEGAYYGTVYGTNSGSCYFDSSCERVDKGSFKSYDAAPGEPDASCGEKPTFLIGDGATCAAQYYTGSGGYTPLITQTLSSKSIILDECGPSGIDHVTADVREELSGLVTHESALIERGDPTLSEWAWKSSDSLTTPESDEPINFSAAQAVINNIGLKNLTPGTLYELTVLRERAAIESGSPACCGGNAVLGTPTAPEAYTLVIEAENWCEIFAWRCTGSISETPDPCTPGEGPPPPPPCVEGEGSCRSPVGVVNTFPVYCAIAAYAEARVAEAAAWNAANPEATPRTVGLNEIVFDPDGSPFIIPPAPVGTMERYNSCSLAVVTP